MGHDHKRITSSRMNQGRQKKYPIGLSTSLADTNKSFGNPAANGQDSLVRTGYTGPLSLRFHRVSASQWCLSMRPEFFVSQRNSINLEAAEKIALG